MFMVGDLSPWLSAGVGLLGAANVVIILRIRLAAQSMKIEWARNRAAEREVIYKKIEDAKASFRTDLQALADAVRDVKDDASRGRIADREAIFEEIKDTRHSLRNEVQNVTGDTEIRLRGIELHIGERLRQVELSLARTSRGNNDRQGR